MADEKDRGNVKLNGGRVYVGGQEIKGLQPEAYVTGDCGAVMRATEEETREALSDDAKGTTWMQLWGRYNDQRAVIKQLQEDNERLRAQIPQLNALNLNQARTIIRQRTEFQNKPGPTEDDWRSKLEDEIISILDKRAKEASDREMELRNVVEGWKLNIPELINDAAKEQIQNLVTHMYKFCHGK